MKRERGGAIPTPQSTAGTPQVKVKRKGGSATQPPMMETETSREGWTLVKGKNKAKLKTRRGRPPRPDAILISATVDSTGGSSYASILRGIKGNPQLKELGEQVSGVRKTEKGHLLLELQKGTGDKLGGLRQTLANELGAGIEIKVLTATSERVIEIFDMDEISTKEDVLEALKMSLGSEADHLKDSAISLRSSFRGSQIATVQLPSKLVVKLLESGKIKVGWSRCRVREKVVPTRCYKCWEFGHRSGACKSEVDRSSLCFKCGLSDHKAKDCPNKAKCALCSQRNPQEEANHFTGRGKCPLLRSAIQKKI